MRSTAHDKQCRDDCDGEYRGPIQRVKAPAASAPQWPIEPLLLDQAQGADRKLEISRPSPDGGDDGEDDPALDVAGIVHAVVEGNRDRRGIDEDEKCEDEEPPAFSAMMPSEGQLGEQLRVIVVVFLQGLAAAAPFFTGAGSRVVVCFGLGPL